MLIAHTHTFTKKTKAVGRSLRADWGFCQSQSSSFFAPEFKDMLGPEQNSLWSSSQFSLWVHSSAHISEAHRRRRAVQCSSRQCLLIGELAKWLKVDDPSTQSLIKRFLSDPVHVKTEVFNDHTVLETGKERAKSLCPV